MLQRLGSGLLDLLAPPRCAACVAPLDARLTGFCDACAPLIESAPTHPGPTADRDACLYGGPLRDALHRLKYAGASDVAPALARLAERPARSFGGLVDCLAVVPLHRSRLCARGFNQSALLARPLARVLAVPFEPRLLQRTRDTVAQVGKGRSERAAQLAGVFAASPRARGRAVLVFDDVRTTGATLAEARRALVAAGARAVFTLALAQTPTHDEIDDETLR
jgi:ComF family protein